MVYLFLVLKRLPASSLNTKMHTHNNLIITRHSLCGTAMPFTLAVASAPFTAIRPCSFMRCTTAPCTAPPTLSKNASTPAAVAERRSCSNVRDRWQTAASKCISSSSTFLVGSADADDAIAVHDARQLADQMPDTAGGCRHQQRFTALRPENVMQTDECGVAANANIIMV